MSFDNQSYLRFSLEESVWFQKGQEVDELISISLDPDITIQESDQYITIKGSLELTGEYNREPSFEEDDEEDNADYFQTNPRTIQSVEFRNEEGLCAFTHEFPVEVTIPKNRIQNLDDIDVAVETFDYAFPEKSCLRLTADLMIIGLYGEQQHELFEEEEEPVEIEIEEIRQDQPTFTDDLNGFEFYSKPTIPEMDDRPFEEERNNEEPPEESVEEPVAYVKPEIPEENQELYEPFEVEARKPPEEEEKPEESVEFQSFEEKYPDISLDSGQEEENRKETPIAEPILEEAPPAPIEQIPQEQVEQVEEVVPEITFTPQENVVEPVEDSSEEEEVVPEKKKKKLKNKQSITLSEFFARKEEEEHTKVRMCIVQSGDTLDNLSERYEVSVSQIQRVNQMELNQDVYEGQVLYIPVTQTQT